MQKAGCSVVVAVVLMGALAVGCNTGPDHLGHNNPAARDFDPLVFPWEGQLGDPAQAGTDDFGSTAAVLINSNYITVGDDFEYFNLRKDRVTIKIADADATDNINWSTPIQANLRSVLDLGPARTSVISKDWPGFWFTAAVFDLPPAAAFGTPAAGDYPAMAIVEVHFDGDPTPVHTARFRITGGLGTPNDLADPTVWGQATLQEDLETQRMIRLRGKRGAQGQMFYDGQPPIGGIEFDFEYPTLCARNVRAYPSSDAANATAIIGPATVWYSFETVHVVMVDPKGIDMQFLASAPPYIVMDTHLAGEGPFIDLAFDEDPVIQCGNIENTEYWEIRNLLVTDLDGGVILWRSGVVPLDTPDAEDENAVLRLYAMEVESS